MLAVDVSLFRAINGLSGHPTLDRLFWALSFMGNGGAVWLAMALLLLAGAGRVPGLMGAGYARWRAVGAVMGGAVAVAGATEFLLKEMVRRPRPFVTLPNVHVIGGPASGFSFPSGHTLASFAAAAALLAALQYWGRQGRPLAPSWTGWGAVLLAAAIGFSRIYNGQHYPLDVLCGAGLGWLVGRCGWALFTAVAAPAGSQSSPSPSRS